MIDFRDIIELRKIKRFILSSRQKKKTNMRATEQKKNQMTEKSDLTRQKVKAMIIPVIHLWEIEIFWTDQ